MKKSLYGLAVLSAVSTMALSAHAEGVYIGLGGGVNYLHNTEFNNAVTNTGVDVDSGWAGAATLGYGFSNGFRTELELSYRSNDIDTVGLAGPASGGRIDSWAAMANVLYDLNMLPGLPENVRTSNFRPYIGAGAGMTMVKFNDVRPVGGSVIDDDDNEFTVQGIAGVTYRLNNNWQTFVDYRYLHALDPEVKDRFGVGYDSEYDTSTILVGLRYSFGSEKPVREAPKPMPRAEAPRPAPVQKAEPAKYIVFFDFDKSSITPEAAATLRTVAESYKATGFARLELTGHADRAGTESYNMKLSQRRAEAVKRELVRLGVTGSNIVALAKGETSPLVATDDGVREPQNRRVEIVAE